MLLTVIDSEWINCVKSVVVGSVANSEEESALLRVSYLSSV